MASKNASIVDEWLEDDNLMLIEAWARDGYTESDIAARIGVNPSTINYWKKKYPEIAKALRTGKEIVDYKVENALLKAALGYTTTEIKVVIGKQTKDGRVFQITKETTTKEIAPNVTACAMWLNNRKPDQWKRNRDKVVEIENEDTDLQITIVRGPKKDDEEDTINREITLSRQRTNTSNNTEEVQKDKLLKESDKDYWPEDWDDEEE